MPGFVFESGEGHELKGIDVQSVDVGGGEDGSQNIISLYYSIKNKYPNT